METIKIRKEEWHKILKENKFLKHQNDILMKKIIKAQTALTFN